MTHVDKEQGVEVIGMLPSAVMVLFGMAIAILPVLMQIGLIITG